MKTILVILDPGVEPFRSILKGLGAESSGLEGIDWNYRHPLEDTNSVIEQSDPDLVVCSISNEGEAKIFRSLGIPVLNVMGAYPVPGLPSIGCSERALWDRLFSFALSKGVETLHWMDVTEQGREKFERLRGDERHQENGIALEFGFELTRIEENGKLIKNQLLVFDRDEAGLDFLQKHPRLGVLGVGMMGIGNDELLCERSHPQLTSLVLDGEGCGRKMAHLIDKVLAGLEMELQPLEIEAFDVCERESTSGLKSRDNRIRQAMVFFRNNMSLGHNVEELSRSTNMSYRTFHRLFCEETGMSPKNWMDREQFEKAKQLLSKTTEPLSKIASHCGYSDDKALIRAFRRLARKPPSAFR